ncbi:MAG TPA: hypothetical protein VEZ41_16140 [Allosphingosinicella sp.]|nr:hypothetical protein [Allosphingosinicella sp.]
MADKKFMLSAKERVATPPETDQDVSYSMWRRGSAAQVVVEALRRPGAMVRG